MGAFLVMRGSDSPPEQGVLVPAIPLSKFHFLESSKLGRTNPGDVDSPRKRGLPASRCTLIALFLVSGLWRPGELLCQRGPSLELGRESYLMRS